MKLGAGDNRLILLRHSQYTVIDGSNFITKGGVGLTIISRDRLRCPWVRFTIAENRNTGLEGKNFFKARLLDFA